MSLFKKNKGTETVNSDVKMSDMKRVLLEENTAVGIFADDIAIFEKVSFKQYLADCKNILGDDVSEDVIKIFYDKIKLPKRGTEGSAGYDFFCPFGFELKNGQSIIIPTGIKSFIRPDYFLMAVPRSGHGFKNHIVLANTVGIIDSDYAIAENEGHIMIKLIYQGFEESDDRCVDINYISDDGKSNIIPCKLKEEKHENFQIKENNAFCQCLLVKYGLAQESIASVVPKGRKNGFGSTDNK